MKRYNIFILFSCIAILTTLSINSPELLAKTKSYKRTFATYSVPDVILTNQDREKVHLKNFLNSEKPVLLEFIFSTCTTICPVLSAGFSNMQKKLGPDMDKVHLVSISIDPEYDTPERMRHYLDRYRAKPGWNFFTGTRKDIDKVMYAFDAYVPNKMSHFPLTFLWVPGSKEWVRIYGMISTKDLMSEYKLLINDNK
jgi:protein SCO1/2